MKYELGQLIYYIRENRLFSAPVLARIKVENLHQDLAHTNEQKKLFTPFGESGVFYGTCHGIINESEAYSSREDLQLGI